jgi:UDP-N-acetylmuramoyl-L-alanyl-D-glutamate--2,6-diaminopimelate ligase
MKLSLKEIFIANNLESYYSPELKGITTNLQNASFDDLVFYNFKTETPKDIERFQERRKKSQAKLVITNSSKTSNIDGTIYLSHQDFANLKEIFIDFFYPLPPVMPKFIGITGTNGKTTTVQLITNLLSQNGHSAISVGTIGVCDHFGKLILATEMTTPGKEVIRKIIYENPSVEYIVFEVSSHSLDQDRLKDIVFTAAGWTNFTQDHLDYHQTMEEYFKSKKKIIKKTLEKKVMIPSTQKSLSNKLGKDEFIYASTLSKELVKSLPIDLKIDFNLENLELAVSIVEVVLKRACLVDPTLLIMPAGRIESIKRKKGFVYIDYAHTPDALERVLMGLKKSFPSRPIWLVFGCGGNRDKGKRPLMGKVAGLYSSEVIVTSDNPRDENPESIIKEILSACETGKAIIERREAIKMAITNAPDDAIILVAGKGHEGYQEINGSRFAFNDKDVVLNILDKINEH